MNSLALTPTIDLRSLHREAIFMRIMGVNYVHVKTNDDGDLYVTSHGVPFFQHLLPENWYETKWFTAHRGRLDGTGTVYRVATRPIDSQTLKSIDLVVKWSRVGQDVSLDTFTLERNTNAEFNSPFEEFSLVEELRQSPLGPGESRVLAQKPLAIYAPAERMQLWQTGRSRDKILAKEARHPGVLIDVLRSYILLYGWIKGINAVEAFAGLPGNSKVALDALTKRVDGELRNKGFVVSDQKPAHFILRTRDGKLRARKDGRMPLALVDYELLARTEKRERELQTQRRTEYLVRQRDRFLPRNAAEYPPYLKPWRVFGVDYIVGRAESTSGLLWVVGKDPRLFAYFLPERWRGGHVSLSESGRTMYTQTKDRLHMVWRVSPVGEFPPGDLADPEFRQLFLRGYNSPFEEFALALEMSQRGIPTVYPRAIYMTASPGEVAGRVLDDRAFRRMVSHDGPDGLTPLPADHDYITIWGYWRGLDDAAAVVDQKLWTPLNAWQAVARGLLGVDEVHAIVSRHDAAMRAAGFFDPRLNPDHLLLSHIPGGSFKRDEQGLIEVRHCNFATVNRNYSRLSKHRTADV